MLSHASRLLDSGEEIDQDLWYLIGRDGNLALLNAC